MRHHVKLFTNHQASVTVMQQQQQAHRWMRDQHQHQCQQLRRVWHDLQQQ